MKRLIIVALTTLFFVSCTEHGTESKPTFSVNTSSLEVTDIGGYFEVLYNLKDSNGINPVAVTEAEWIVEVDNSQVGTIGFRVLPNESDTPREATVTLRHISTNETPQFVVKQAATSDTHINTLGDKGCKRIAKMINEQSIDITSKGASKEEIVNLLVEACNKADRPIGTLTFLEALYNVRKNQYYEEPEKYVLEMQELVNILVNIL